MRKLAITLTTAALVAVWASVAVAQEDGPVERVLFIGNSNTSYNGGVHEYFAGFADADETLAIVVDEAISIPLGTLGGHLRGRAPDMIRDGDYDVVALQGDIPQLRSFEPFYEGARRFDGIIDEAGGRTVFYMTWPYASADWVDLGGIAEAYRAIATELGASVAPVSLAMVDAFIARPGVTTIDDTEHQTHHGAYLAAATIYATIFDRSPEGLSFRPDIITPRDAAFLQGITWSAVQKWPHSDSGSVE